MRQHQCTGAAGQRFEFARVAGGGYRIRNAAAGACLEVQQEGRDSGARVSQSSACDDRLSRQFLFRPVPGQRRTFMLVAGHSGKCLDVYAGGQAEGVPVLQWACGDPSTAGNELWRVDAAVDGRRIVTGSPEPSGSPAGTPSGQASAGSAPTPPAGPPVTPGKAGTGPGWGRELPPAGARFSRAYTLVYGERDKGYRPRPGECAWQVHARYWTWGPDGKVYPTWHPPRDRSGCAFGHEHGDDPRRSSLFAATGWPPFGYTNEMLAPSDPARQRDEDHVGHKVQAANGLRAHRDNEDRDPVTMRCDTLLKFHQGTHSRDALTNNLHELFYNARCQYTGSGEVIETHFQALVPLGHPGGFNVSNVCASGLTPEHKHVGPATPPDSPSGPELSDAPDGLVPPQPLGRFIPDAACALATVAEGKHIGTMTEIWVAEVVGGAGGLRSFHIAPLFAVVNPSRYYNPDSPGRTGWVIDLCYRGAKGTACDTVRKLAAGGKKIAPDDPRSPFNGAYRGFSPGAFAVDNHGPTTVYTDVFGLRFSERPFPGAIKQYIAGRHAADEHQGQIINGFTDYAKNPADRIRVPN